MRAFLPLSAAFAALMYAGAALAAPTTVGGTPAGAIAAETSRATAAEAALAPAPASVVAAGTTQVTATVITTPATIVTSAPTGTGLILTATVLQQRIYNRDPANPVLIYPQVGAAIEGQGVNLPVQILSGSDSLCTQRGSAAIVCGN